MPPQGLNRHGKCPKYLASSTIWKHRKGMAPVGLGVQLVVSKDPTSGLPTTTTSTMGDIGVGNYPVNL